MPRTLPPASSTDSRARSMRRMPRNSRATSSSFTVGLQRCSRAFSMAPRFAASTAASTPVVTVVGWAERLSGWSSFWRAATLSISSALACSTVSSRTIMSSAASARPTLPAIWRMVSARLRSASTASRRILSSAARFSSSVILVSSGVVATAAGSSVGAAASRVSKMVWNRWPSYSAGDLALRTLAPSSNPTGTREISVGSQSTAR
ncbi:hypothetical protein D9M68_744520 [compost metagenome]